MENNILQPNHTTCKSLLASPGSPETGTKNNLEGVIVQDYAYPSSFTSSTPAPCLHPIPEIFNQYEGLAEVEYRWTQSPWMYPVPGKILSWLLEMGWITEGEICAHGSPMDLVELWKHNAWLPYPWKPLGSTTIPDNEDRKTLMLTRASDFQQHDATSVTFFTFSPYFAFTPPSFHHDYLISLLQGHMAIHALPLWLIPLLSLTHLHPYLWFHHYY